MKKIIYTCDRCKKEISGHIFKIFAEELEQESEDFTLEDHYPEMRTRDFCQECADFLVGLIDQKCKKGAPAQINTEFEEAVQEMVATSQSDPPPTVDKPAARKVDTGKVLALRKAGWIVKDIAEDVGCSEATVYNILSRAGLTRNMKKAPEPGQQEGQSETN